MINNYNYKYVYSCSEFKTVLPVEVREFIKKCSYEYRKKNKIIDTFGTLTSNCSIFFKYSFRESDDRTFFSKLFSGEYKKPPKRYAKKKNQ